MMMLMSNSFELSPMKQEILSADGNLLIFGGPGSGKTTIALLKAKHMINQGVLKRGQKILFLSFARATISRVEQHAKNVLQECNSSALEITTYHSFIWSILRSHGYLLVPHKIKLLLPHDASIRFAGITDRNERDDKKRHLFSDEGLLHFDLFASKCANLLQRSKILSQIVSEAYPFIMLDEFQDTNQHEWDLITHIGQRSCLIALADPEQRIYDFRGADPARTRQFVEKFHPKEYDFGKENNRSSGTDIVDFGNDLLIGRNKGKTYNHVGIHTYPPRKANGELFSVKGHILKRLKANAENNEWSLAVLVPTNKLMITMSDFLGKTQQLNTGGIIPAVQHEVWVNPEGLAIAATTIAKLLELSSIKQCRLEVLVADICEHILGRQGDRAVSAKDQELANALKNYFAIGDYSKPIKGKNRQKILTECEQILTICSDVLLTGEVATDWIKVRDALLGCQSDCLKKLYQDALSIKLLRKGSLLNSSLSQIWRTNSNYFGATEAIRNALTQEHFATSSKTWRGVNVMTIHKAKGKEFDEVIIFEGAFSDRFVVSDDLDKAKLVLRVAVTRARNSVIILTPKMNPSTLLF